jgi:hypothetical protein
MQIRRSPDCRNSPKNRFIEDLTIALTMQDIEGVSSSISEQVQWKVVGRYIARGRQEFIEALPQSSSRGASALQIGRVVSHGRAGAVNGTIELINEEVREFCHVFEFTNAKGTSVERVTSYIIGS